MMLQEIFMPDGKRIMAISDQRCLYDKITLQSIANAGYIVRIDGRKLRKSKEVN